MTIPQYQIDALKTFGYTEDEAQFLYLVATHSGYFLTRQFLNFVGAKRGYRTHSLTQKLIMGIPGDGDRQFRAIVIAIPE